MGEKLVLMFLSWGGEAGRITPPPKHTHVPFILHGPMMTSVRRSWGTAWKGERGRSARRLSGL